MILQTTGTVLKLGSFSYRIAGSLSYTFIIVYTICMHPGGGVVCVCVCVGSLLSLGEWKCFIFLPTFLPKMTHRVGAGQTLTEGINEGTEEPTVF